MERETETDRHRTWIGDAHPEYVRIVARACAAPMHRISQTGRRAAKEGDKTPRPQLPPGHSQVTCAFRVLTTTRPIGHTPPTRGKADELSLLGTSHMRASGFVAQE